MAKKSGYALRRMAERDGIKVLSEVFTVGTDFTPEDPEHYPGGFPELFLSDANRNRYSPVMSRQKTVLVVSDIHHAGDAEMQRGWHETRIIANPVLRLAVRLYRHFIWRRDPFSQNHLLDDFLRVAGDPDLVVANGDYSCDTAFVGVCDDATFQSAQECLGKLRRRFPANLQPTIGDHELGKESLFGGHGGLRLSSWHRALEGLGLPPFWRIEIGDYTLLGVTSSLIALPVYQPETLIEERKQWLELRASHLAEIREAFASLKPRQRVLLFCHDPTALPFLWREEEVRLKLGQVEHTIIGHLHSNLFFWKSRVLAGMPAIGFLGNSIRRMSTALKDARYWKPFNVKLCPALAGIELLNDGGYCEFLIDEKASHPARFYFHPLRGGNAGQVQSASSERATAQSKRGGSRG
jgi:hypothetical protein